VVPERVTLSVNVSVTGVSCVGAALSMWEWTVVRVPDLRDCVVNFWKVHGVIEVEADSGVVAPIVPRLCGEGVGRPGSYWSRIRMALQTSELGVLKKITFNEVEHSTLPTGDLVYNLGNKGSKSAVMKFRPTTGFSGALRLLMTYTFYASGGQTLTAHVMSYLYWRPHEREITAVSIELRGEEGHAITVAGTRLDALISSVFFDPRYKRKFVFLISSTPVLFRLDVQSNGSVSVQAEDPHWSGSGHVQLKAVLSGNVANGSSSASFEQFNALPNVTMKVFVDVFVTPVANTPTLRTTVLTPFAQSDSAVVLRIDELSLVDIDGSEELSARLMISNGSSVAAVYANDKRCTAVSGDGNAAEYELPISTRTAILDMVITLLPDRDASSHLTVTVIGSARELFYSNSTDQALASATSEALVGWILKSIARYTQPLDLWLEASQGTAVVLPIQSALDLMKQQGPVNGTAVETLELWRQTDSGVRLRRGSIVAYWVPIARICSQRPSHFHPD